MSEDKKKRYARFTSLNEAEEYGIDPNHIAGHMYQAVICAFDGDERGLDLGFYYQFRDTERRTWTLSVIPEDGGVISEALLDEAQEGT